MENNQGIFEMIAIIGLVAVIIVMVITRSNTINPVINMPGASEHTISVSGISDLTVSPDEALIYVNVVTDGDVASTAQSLNSDISNKVIAALKQAGIQDSNIETSNYYLSKKQKWNPVNQTYMDNGYTLTNTLKVTTTDVKNVGKYVDAAVGAGANGIDSITFDLTKESKKTITTQALAMATANAKDKATSIAASAGIKLGNIFSIQESNFNYVPYVYSMANGIATSAKMGAETSIPAQKVDVTGNVQIAFTIA